MTHFFSILGIIVLKYFGAHPMWSSNEGGPLVNSGLQLTGYTKVDDLYSTFQVDHDIAS